MNLSRFTGLGNKMRLITHIDVGYAVHRFRLKCFERVRRQAKRRQIARRKEGHNVAAQAFARMLVLVVFYAPKYEIQCFVGALLTSEECNQTDRPETK